MIVTKNLFSDIPTTLREELVERLVDAGPVRIERIVSRGHASPEGFWYDQAGDEWVALLSGSATLRFEGEEPVDMKPGDWLRIPAHSRHRVERTDADRDTIWLAVHLGV
jgi:cupin 2 domain-containing protein